MPVVAPRLPPAQTLPRSWYTDTTAPSPLRPPLTGDTETDVCVVGAGMTGAAAALHLAERGYRVRVLEEHITGFGASGRSGGQLIAGFAAGLGPIRSQLAPDEVQAYWDLGTEAVTLVKDRIQRHGIACDFVPGHIDVALKPRQVADLVDTAEEWWRLGYKGLEVWDRRLTQSRVASARYIGALYDPGGGHLHPLNYTLGLAAAAERAGAVIHEATPLVGFEEQGDRVAVQTPHGVVRTRWLILGGNAYLWQRVPSIGHRIMPVGTYIIGTAPLGEERARALIPGNEAVSDVNFVLNYFRMSSDHRLLFGGRVSYSRIEPASVARAMRRTMLATFPDLSDVAVDYAWGGYVAITVNRLPHFGRIGRRTLFAQGFSGHGVGLTSLAGQLMAEMIEGQEERFDLMARIRHLPFPGGRRLRTPLLVAAMAVHRVRDWL
ncbi:FAD-binding oxidoreductase [Roseospira marina]|uniref:FAD-binding oxidoreductase n=1 Tax=Roseospira marina TaxID=140057 RepID=A0A5M6IBK6_9PROT|nr:FAD-binding oxidoreductase [Roseospira marina]KAA5605621.1 FAD-binding oxidoreductase [Roseospira marina]MBB4313308.1 gamma-glutamylputrescine oxidase [Roseospira marina]MBB5085951.1 gamma-glutamylputrescine oxidase [Roseospira marina]